MSRAIPKNQWKWFGDPGHFIRGRDCEFHLCTQIGPWLISTVGKLNPDEGAREIYARSKGITLEGKGDARKADFLRKHGYVEVGCGRLFETMVFRAGSPCDADGCHCGLPNITGEELDVEGYNEAGAATAGHMWMCERWARKTDAAAPQPTEQPEPGEVDETLEKELFYLLFNYESDEPYEGNGDEPVIRYSRTTADGYLYEPHCGDCTDEAHTCMRCYAEDCKHKARWLASHFQQRQGERVPEAVRNIRAELVIAAADLLKARPGLMGHEMQPVEARKAVDSMDEKIRLIAIRLRNIADNIIKSEGEGE